MLQENCRRGMKVIFGRPNGEKTLGEVVKINDKKAKVKILEDRGQRSQAGVVWGVPYSMMEPVNDQAVASVQTTKPEPLTYNVFQPASEQHILQAIACCYSDLSPESLTCDGELSQGQVRSRYNELHRKLKGLFTALGRTVSEGEAYDWDNQRRAYEVKKRATAV